MRHVAGGEQRRPDRERDRLGLDEIRGHQQLASDLHASVAQTLFAIGVEARIALDLADAPARELRLRAIEQLAGRAREELYETLATLSHVPAQVSLAARMASELQGFEAATGCAVSFVCSGQPEPLGPLAEDLLRDVFAEALRNVRKHAPCHGGTAMRVAAELAFHGDCVKLRVSNDGVGARTATRSFAAVRGGGYLGLLAARAAELRGTLDLRVTDCGGASLQLRLPRAAFTAR